MIFGIIFLTIVLLSPIVIVYWERNKFNGGKCKHCGNILIKTDTYDDGGRGWTCTHCGRKIVINIIDENKFRGRY